MEIAGRRAMVTGAGNGIGEAIARAFAAAGAESVAVVDIDRTHAQAVADDIGGRAYELDVADPEATANVIAAIEDDAGPLDIVVLNAGVAIGGSFDTPDDAWTQAWQVNVMAHVYTARAVIPGMLERGAGAFVVTASAAGLLTNLDAAPYTVTKHGAVAFAEWLAVTYGQRGLQVCCVCPQFVDTNMLEVFGESSDQMRTWVHGLAITPEDVASDVVEALGTGQFLVLPHPEVRDYVLAKAQDRDAWIEGMQRLQSRMLPES